MELNMDNLNIRETKMSYNGDSGIMWVTLDKFTVRSIYQRNVSIKNPDIRVITYFPKQLWQKKKNLDIILSEARKKDSKLRTQVRMGDEDLQLFTKNVGEPFWMKTPINHYGDPDQSIEFVSNGKRKEITPEKNTDNKRKRIGDEKEDDSNMTDVVSDSDLAF